MSTIDAARGAWTESSPDIQIQRQAKAPHIWGYDAVRFLAMMCVALRHLISIHDDESVSMSYLIGLPQFSVLSGYLALRSRGNAFSWISRRISRIYPSYLLCLVVILFAASWSSYKPISWSLAMAQMLGIAPLAYPTEVLVGVHTWFITFIVCCYGLAALVRWQAWLLWPFWGLAAIGCAYRVSHCELFLAFASGGLLTALPTSLFPTVRQASIAMVALFLGLYLGCEERAWLVPMSGMVGLFVGSFFAGRRPIWVAKASRITYEFYLCHGPVYLVMERWIGVSLPVNLIVGTGLAIGAASLLHDAAERMRRRLGRLPWLGTSKNRVSPSRGANLESLG